MSRPVLHYNLEAIIAVGYRVKSARGIQFRIWATQRLQEFLVKGFAINEEKLKQEPDYFEQLLAKIRDIRSSGKVFWRKALDIYATSVDYDASAEASQSFLPRRKTRCTGRRTATRRRKWFTRGRTRASRSWACKRRAPAGLSAGKTRPSPKLFDGGGA